MLYAQKPKSRKIERLEMKGNSLFLFSEMGTHRICPMNERIVRVTYTQSESFSSRKKPAVVIKPLAADAWNLWEDEQVICFSSSCIKIVIQKETGSYRYYNEKNALLLKERDHDSKVLERFWSYKMSEDEEVKVVRVETVDGVKEIVQEAAKIPEEELYHTRMHLDFQEHEALYGLGQQEEGLLNLRGQTVYVHQANRKIAVPMLVSSLGYGILVDTYAPMIFNDTAAGSYLYTEADDEMDYYFIVGQDLNEVVKGYRTLTGKAAMLPKWAFGYMQSQERYETAQEILDIAQEYRKRELGIDCLVLDWMSWEDGKWGQKSFDFTRFPDPKAMVEQLHEQNIHFMISIWPTMNRSTDNYLEMKEKGALLPASEIYNALDENARKLYWEQVKRGLFCYGIDAWWCDSSEPLTVEWTHTERMEPALLYAEYCRELANHLPAWTTNAFPLYHAMTIYNGQREETRDKRVCNLTRSAYSGQQRFGTILWSGDTSASWKTLKEQIASGLNFVATGLPYWTVDIGAFFVKKSTFWYWDGAYEETTDDEGYLELYTRWYQWGAFLPIFRAHGTDCRREMWEFDHPDHRFYKAIKKVNQLRYRLMPYIYSQAGHVWLEDASMMKMLVFDFAEDSQVLDIKDQYMFGESIMVCPVTEPMYYAANHVPIVDQVSYTRKVYLPKGCGWYDFWTNTYYEGGQWLDADAPIDKIPLFVKEGSILPIAEVSMHTSQKANLTFCVYAGKDASYSLYEDAGDGYGYEEGEYQLTQYHWYDQKRVLVENASGEEVHCRVIG